MLTIEEIESACAGRAAAEPDPHPVDAPALTLQAKFFPLGFPLELRTNSEEVLALSRTQWGYFEQHFDTEPMLAEVYVVESPQQDAAAQQECPPQPQYRFLEPLLTTIADPQHYSIADLSRSRTKIVATSAALRHPLYFRYFFLECGAGVHAVAHGSSNGAHTVASAVRQTLCARLSPRREWLQPGALLVARGTGRKRAISCPPELER